MSDTERPRSDDFAPLPDVIEEEVRRLVAFAVTFELQARNLDQPHAEKYGTHPDGRPRHAPEWYVAHDIKTAINEPLHGALRRVMEAHYG